MTSQLPDGEAVIFGTTRHASRVARIALVVLAALGLTASVGAFFILRAWDQARFQIAFERESLQSVSVLRNGISSQLEVLDALRAFYQATERVARPEFARFAAVFLKRDTGLQAIEWVPRVPFSERQDHEQSARRDGFPGFQFTERDDSGKLVRAAQRPEYYPVYYVEPYKGNENAIGFDAASNRMRSHILSGSRDTGKVAMTPPIHLVQDEENQQGFAVFMPVYAKGVPIDSVKLRRQHIAGFFVVVFRAQAFFKRVLWGHEFPKIDLRIYDESPEQAKTLLFRTALSYGDAQTSGLQESKISSSYNLLTSIDLGGRTWSIVTTPTPSFLASKRKWLPWAALTIGILFTSVLASYVFQIQKGTETARQLVQQTTEREIAERALVQSEKKFRLFMDNSPAVAWIKDEEGRYVYISKSLGERFGVTQNDWIGKTDFEIWPEQNARTFWESDQEVLAANQTIGIVAETPDAYGSIGVWLNHKFPFEDASGRRYVGGVGIDITRQKRVEEELRASEELFRISFEEANVGMCLVGLDGQLLEVNEEMTKIFGYSRDEFRAMNVNDIALSEDRYLSESFIESALDGQVARTGFEKRYLHKEGHVVTCRVVSSLVRDVHGKPLHFVSHVLDITDRRKAEEEQESLRKQLLQAQKMESIGTLTGGIAHDFNNMLQIINGFAEILLMNTDESDSRFSDLQKILETGLKGAAMVKRLLAFSKKAEVDLEPLNLNTVVLDSIGVVERSFPKMVQIEATLGEDLAIVNADALQIEQVLLNLYINAKEAMPKGGRISVTTRNTVVEESDLVLPPGPYVLVQVSDNGDGMNGETLDRIFDPFFTTKGWDFKKGTGLGLSVSKGIVEQHGGWIGCESELGVGTTFRVYLPKIDSSPLLKKRQCPVEIPKCTATLLVVDDEEYVRSLAKLSLEQAGYTVILASSGREALTIYQEQQASIDLVILDLIMPEMGGEQCLQGLLEINSHVAVIVSTGHLVPRKQTEWMMEHVKGFVDKPYRAKQLLEALAEALNT